MEQLTIHNAIPSNPDHRVVACEGLAKLMLSRRRPHFASRQRFLAAEAAAPSNHASGGAVADRERPRQSISARQIIPALSWKKPDLHRALREIELLNPFSMKASQEIAALAHIIAGGTLWGHRP